MSDTWNWDQIRFFLALAEHKTLSMSARSLNVSHTTVLRRIRSFEDQLQAQLFTQTRSGYRLTQAGHTLFAEANKMRSTVTALSRNISGADNQMAGEVAITTTDTLARYIMPKILTKLSTKYKDIRFSLFMSNTLNNIDDREVDIAIRTGRQPPESLIGRKVGEVKFRVVASRSYIKKHGLKSFPKNVAEHRFVVLDESYSGAPFYQWFKKRIHNRAHCTTVSNFLCAAALAREGMGIAVVPSYMLSGEATLVALQTHGVIAPNDLWVLSHSDLRDTERVRVVRQYLYDQLPKYL
jgi:DNA-binding transcriptional LysR family regulator